MLIFACWCVFYLPKSMWKQQSWHRKRAKQREKETFLSSRDSLKKFPKKKVALPVLVWQEWVELHPLLDCLSYNAGNQGNHHLSLTRSGWAWAGAGAGNCDLKRDLTENFSGSTHGLSLFSWFHPACSPGVTDCEYHVPPFHQDGSSASSETEPDLAPVLRFSPA